MTRTQSVHYRYKLPLLLIITLLLLTGTIIFVLHFTKPIANELTREGYLELYNYRLEQDSLSTSDNELIRTKITDFFSSNYPSFVSITFYDYETQLEPPKTSFSIVSNSEESFKGELLLSDSSFDLNIFSDSSDPVFSFNKEKTKNNQDKSLAVAVIDRLPYSSTLSNNIEFLVYYLGGDENILEISIDTDKIYPEFCEEAKKKTLEWLTTVNLSLNETLTKDNLSCQED